MSDFLANAIITAVPPGQTASINLNNDKLVISSTHFTTNPSDCGYILRWSRFRKIKSLEICLPSNGIVLLDGRSGIGKTSVLEAISFVLYDDAGNTCYPRHERASKKKHDPTWVELSFPNGLTIYRQRRPNLLRVQGNGVNLMDDSAQSYINRTLGSLNNWLVGGYLRQRELCAFFSMSSDDKLSLLQQMSLSEHSTGLISSPEKFELLLNRTLEKIILLSRHVQETEMQTKVYAEMYMRLYNQCTEEIRARKLWTPEELSEYLKKYQVVVMGNFNQQLQGLLLNLKSQTNSKSQLIRSKITESQIQIAQINESMKQRVRLQELLKENENQLKDIPDNTTENIHQYEKALADIAEQISLAQRTERRSQLLAAKTEIQRRFDLIPDETSKYSWSDLDHYDKIISGPTADQIEEQLNEIQLAKDYQQKLVLYQKYQNALDQVQSLQRHLDTYPKNSVSDEIEDITKKIWALSLQQKKLTCPKCSATLQLANGKLDLMEDCHDHIEGISLTELESQKLKYKRTETLYQGRVHVEKLVKSAQDKLSELQPINLPLKPKLADYPLYQLDGLVSQLIEAKKFRESLPIDLGNTSEERKKLTHAQERIRLLRDIDSISKELTGLTCEQNQPVEVKNLETRRIYLTSKLAEYRCQETRQAALKETQKQLLLQLKNYPEGNTIELEDQIKKFQGELEILIQESQNLEYDINAQMQVNQLVELYTQHDQYQKVYQESTQRLMALQKIRATLITAEYIILDNVLAELNRTIGEVLDILFIEPISVTIRSLRQLKTDDRIKPQINCQIIYDGAECSKITELSGGEQIRISLALAIAFSRFINAPFLILDESLSTLDVLTKESTISMLRRYLPNKLVIAVNHDTTVGVYDSVIHLTKPGE